MSIIYPNLRLDYKLATHPSDLNMLLLTGGCERTEEEYHAAGFELT